MTTASKLSGLQCNAAGPVYPPALMAIVSSADTLIDAVIAEFVRVQAASPGVDRVEVRDRFVFTYTTNPRNRRLSCFGFGETITDVIAGRFAEVANFRPQFFDTFHHGAIPGDPRALIIKGNEWFSEQWEKRTPGTEVLRLPAMLYVWRAIENIWHCQIGMIRGQSDVAQYLRITAAHEMQASLAVGALGLNDYAVLVRSCLRFSFYNSLIRGTDYRPLVKPTLEAEHIAYNVRPNSQLQADLLKIGFGRNRNGFARDQIRFDVMLSLPFDMLPLREFAASSKRDIGPKICFFVTQGQAPASFAKIAVEARVEHKHAPLMVFLSRDDLSKLVANAEGMNFRANDLIIAKLIERAFNEAVVLYDYNVECESFVTCGNRVVNRWPFVGLQGAQVRQIAEHGYTELTGMQVERNLHMLSVEQLKAAVSGQPVFINTDDDGIDVEPVCCACGSDSDDGDDEL